MGMGLVPQINERSALAVGVASPFFLLGMFQFGERGVFTNDFGGRIVGGDFLPLTVGRTFIFHRCHGGMFDRNRWVKVFKEEDMVKKKRNEMVFCISDVKGMSLSTNDMEECKGSAVKKVNVLMKRRLCFRITTILGNSKR